MNVREQIQKILDDLLLPLGILSHHIRRPKVDKLASGGKINNDVFIVYRVVSSGIRVYGGGQSRLQRTTFDINYYYRYTDSNSDSIAAAAQMRSIEAAFKSSGWHVINGQSDLYDNEVDFRGINIEVAYTEVASG